ncbi:hypothetical protein [Nostoc sp.]|uniref:hypothetical protein n=1 Tax=Nostoc sp. TaxID=1180 RepID=UPI002FF53BC4
MNEYASFPEPDRNHSVFIHCPSQAKYCEYLCALTLAVIASGYGVKRDFGLFNDHNVSFENIAKYILKSKYSIHDCSFCKITTKKAVTEYGRYNLPIELVMALAERHRIQRIHKIDNYKINHEISIFIDDKHAYGGGRLNPDFSQNLKKREQKLRKCIYSKHFSSCRA